MKKIKLFVFILLIICFITVLFYSIFGTQLSFLSVKEIKETRKLKKDLITELKINNIDAVYEKEENIYYYMISEKYEGNLFVLNLSLDSSLKYKIVDETLNIIKVNYQKPFRVIIYNDKYYFETEIQITNLPLINILSKKKLNTNYENTTFKYINTDSKIKVVDKYTKIHVRGSSSSYLDKKSYKIKFYNKSYNDSQKVLISNFYYGDSLVLDAVYRDNSKIRNILSTQIWNDMSDDFTDLNINSEFVEVFINNEYKGLYVLTEPINRTKLNLEKESKNNGGIVIKTVGWRTISSNLKFKNIKGNSYLDYEIKYPNNEEYYPEVWEKFLSKISDYYNPNVKTTDEVIYNTFNENNYIDILIFNSFTTNIDSNMVRNLYFYMENFESSEVYIQPWDMEFSYGLYLDDSFGDQLNYDNMYLKLFYENTPEINEKIINRYWQLRKTVLTKEYFDKLLDGYLNELNKGAAMRDSNAWYKYDVKKEIEEIRTWLHKRIDFFDEYIRKLENE